jgi:hypothetical protein
MILLIEKKFNISDNCYYLTELLDFLVSQGMQPPAYFKTILTGPPAKEGKSNLVLLSQVEKCEGWEPEDEKK